MFINKTLVFQQSPGIPLLLSTLPLASQPSRDTARPACFVRHPRRHEQLPQSHGPVRTSRDILEMLQVHRPFPSDGH